MLLIYKIRQYFFKRLVPFFGGVIQNSRGLILTYNPSTNFGGGYNTPTPLIYASVHDRL